MGFNSGFKVLMKKGDNKFRYQVASCWLFILKYPSIYKIIPFQQQAEWSVTVPRHLSGGLPLDRLPLGTYRIICLCSLERVIRFIRCSQFLLCCCGYPAMGVHLLLLHFICGPKGFSQQFFLKHFISSDAKRLSSCFQRPKLCCHN